jgi:arabinofuranan 3-O-arabinosyltransferase
VLEVAENFNEGWVAHAGERALQPVRVDGWKQAFVIPAGVGGEVSLEFAPDEPYRWGLLGGLIAVLLVVFVAIRPPRAGQAPPVRSRALPLVTAGLVAAGVVLTFGLVGLALLVPAAFVLRRGLPVVAFAGVLGATLVAAVVGIRPEGPAVILQAVLLVLAWAAVLRAGWPAGGSSAVPGVRSGRN